MSVRNGWDAAALIISLQGASRKKMDANFRWDFMSGTAETKISRPCAVDLTTLVFFEIAGRL
jgi:hypothetical protein